MKKFILTIAIIAIGFLSINAQQSCPDANNIVTSNVTFEGIDISWDADTTVYMWQVRYKEQSDSYWRTRGTMSNSLTLTYLNDTTIYDFEVRAYCGYRNYGNWSTTGSFTTLFNANAPVCNTPKNVTITNIAHTRALISWDNDSSQYYHIRYKKATDTQWRYAYSKTNTRALHWLSDTTEYILQLRSYCGYRNYSDWSQDYKFTTLSNANAPACVGPTNTKVVDITYNAAKITWDNIAGVTYYQVRYKKAVDSLWITRYGYNGMARLYYLDDSTIYDYEVRTRCGYNDFSPWTATSQFTTLKIPAAIAPITPTNIAVSKITSNSVFVEWDADTTAMYFYVHYKAKSDSYWRTRYSKTNSVNLTYLMDSTDYELEVRSINKHRIYSSWSSPVSFTTLDAGPCIAPSNITITDIKSNQVTVNFNADSNYYYYQIKYKSANDKYERYRSFISTPFELKYLMDTTEYTYSVRAVCSYMSYSSWTNDATFTTLKSDGSGRKYGGSNSNFINNSYGNAEVYPNPTNGTFTLNMSDFDYTHINVYDYKGSLVKTEKKAEDHKYKLDNLSSGIYFIQLIDNYSNVKVKKIILK